MWAICFVGVFIFILYFSDFCQTNYLHPPTDLYEICRNCRNLAVDKRYEVTFLDLSIFVD